MADDEVFVDMQRAAVNLCRNLGYGAAPRASNRKRARRGLPAAAAAAAAARGRHPSALPPPGGAAHQPL